MPESPNHERPLPLPRCALLGYLGKARDQLGRNQLSAAWQSTLGALLVRPYHPEAYQLLAEIALAAGDAATARRCARHAGALAPAFPSATDFPRSPIEGPTRPTWLVLPPSLPQDSASSAFPAPVRLSVCLIAKNEERFLPQCLASVKGLADQIVLVDTGSTDRTVEIAKEHGAEVHYFPWNDDFSAARNAALEWARGDWILTLDADEELPPESHAALRRLLNTPEVIAWRLPIIDVGREDEGCSYVPRLFRNAPALFYVGRIHEQVFSSLEVRREQWGLANRLGDAPLRHHGYRPEVVKDRQKIERNLRLLQTAIEESPEEPHLLMNYGLELARSQQLALALAQYRKAFQLLAAQPAERVVPELRETLLSQFTTRLMASKDFPEIVRVLTSPLAATGGLNASLHFTLGLAYLELKQPGEAAEQMRQCLAKRSRPSLTPLNKDILGAAPHHCLARCLERLGHTAEAAGQFKLAIELDPQSVPARLDYARFLAAHQQPVEALNLCFALTRERPNLPQVWWLGGQVALSQPEFLDVALDWTAEAQQHLPAEVSLLQQRAEALTLADQAACALPLWRQLSAQATPPVLSALILCETAVGDHRFSPPPHLEVDLSREFLKLYQRLLHFRARSTVDGLHSRLEMLRGKLPSVVAILEAALSVASTQGRTLE